MQVVAKNLMLYRRNKEWWSSEVELKYKISYYAHLALSYARFFATRNKCVRYLGRPFVYDNIAGPLNLQGYPKEVGNYILANLSKDAKLERVLDIGGNIGQFATTLKYFCPDVAIDIFEPNTNILPYLETNTKGLSN